VPDYAIASDELNSRLVHLAQEWDKTEELLKIAEISAKKAMDSAVWELRYAGRRVVDAINGSRDNKSIDEIKTYIDDAIFDCLRARHDAIDACTAYISREIELAVDIYGADKVRSLFPPLDELFGLAAKIADFAVESRKDRTNRDALYRTLQAVNFPAFCKLFAEFSGQFRNMRFDERAKRRKQIIDVSLYATILSTVFVLIVYVVNSNAANALFAGIGFVATTAGAIFGWLAIYSDIDQSDGRGE
jgi:hypothetical protein